MKKLAHVLRGMSMPVVVLAAALASCSAPVLNPDHLLPCECGNIGHDVFGCPAACGAGEACDNPLCTCEHEGELPDVDADKEADR